MTNLHYWLLNTQSGNTRILLRHTTDNLNLWLRRRIHIFLNSMNSNQCISTLNGLKSKYLTDWTDSNRRISWLDQLESMWFWIQSSNFPPNFSKFKLKIFEPRCSFNSTIKIQLILLSVGQNLLPAFYYSLSNQLPSSIMFSSRHITSILHLYYKMPTLLSSFQHRR